MTRTRVIAAIVLAIAAATLIPAHGPTRAFTSCLTCGFRWLADWFANVAMFIPLGGALNWKRKRLVRTTLVAGAFSIAIELAQTAIPGRDPALGDVLANSLGGAIGALLGSRPFAGLSPKPSIADRLLPLAIGVV